jgi:hypothetical protein
MPHKRHLNQNEELFDCQYRCLDLIMTLFCEQWN